MSFAESTAKNGEKTFSIDSVFFHSSYAPSREIERICSAVNFNINPEIIILIEPGLNYSYKLLKQKFPYARIGIIRIIEEIKEKDWDFIIPFSTCSKPEQLKNYLVTNFSETQLLSSVLYSWPTADKLFPTECDFCWQEYKNALIYEKTILVTRQYFEKKWFINSLNFIKYTNNFITQKKKINLPIVITASGPSLKPVLNSLSENQNKIFIIALSSSLTCLLERNIIPDLVMSTDGGYWAGEHLKLLKQYKNLPVAAVFESYIPKSILQNNPVLPLYYKDQLINEYFPSIPKLFSEAQRNGTISGTALEYAKSIANNSIYFCGLDLQEQQGFQHTQSNQLELNNSISDKKLRPKEKRIYPGIFKSESLLIYRNWFENYKNTSNLFRVIDDQNNSRLGSISDISSSDFDSFLNKSSAKEEKVYFETLNDSKILELKDQLCNITEKLSSNDNYLKQLFPIDYLSINHALNDEDKTAAESILNNKKEKLFKTLQRNYE